MKKIPVFTSILLVAGVLATMAFSHPLIVRNGVVRGTSTGSFDIRDRGLVQTYILRQGMTMLPSGATLAVGDHVTVFADCFHTGIANRNASATSARKTGGTTAAATSMNNSGRHNLNAANENQCIALAVLVRKSVTAASAGAVPATGGTATATAAPSTSGATGSATPAASATSAASATPAASSTMSATPMVCPTATATATGTPATSGSGTMATGTATATMMPCVTPTATP